MVPRAPASTTSGRTRRTTGSRCSAARRGSSTSRRGALLPPPLRARAARSRLAQPGRAPGVRRHLPLLARPWRRRHPRRRRARRSSRTPTRRRGRACARRELHSFDRRRAVDRPELHPLYRELRRLVDAYGGERFLVGEVFFRDPARVAQYVRPDELHLVFNFTLLFEDWTSDGFRSAIDRTMVESRRGRRDAELGAREPRRDAPPDALRRRRRGAAPRARRGAAAARAARDSVPLRGTGARARGGRPAGRRCARTRSSSARTGERLGRDGCRVPLPWTRSLAEWRDPWLPQPESFRERSVEAEEADGASMLALWRAAIAARPSGAFAWVDAAPRDARLLARRSALRRERRRRAGAGPGADGSSSRASPSREHIPAGAAAWISKR